MRKRIIALVLCFTMILSCMACNSSVQPQKDNQQSQSEPDTEKSICGDTELPQKDVEVGNIPNTSSICAFVSPFAPFPSIDIAISTENGESN